MACVKVPWAFLIDSVMMEFSVAVSKHPVFCIAWSKHLTQARV